MKITIDTKQNVLVEEKEGEEKTFELYSKDAFERLSRYWLKIGWNMKYTYSFSWMGRPIIQLPEDIIRIQEVIYELQTDVIIETGVAHGGSLIYYASLCKVMEKGKVIGLDVEIRPHNREAIEAHPLFPYITLIEGSSTDTAIIEKVKSIVKPEDTVLVVLDSNHSKQHVLDELEAYHSIVTPGSYIIACDGIMLDLHDVPRGVSDWTWNNPLAAAEEFQHLHPEFEIEQPRWPFNESPLSKNVTHWPGAWLKKIN